MKIYSPYSLNEHLLYCFSLNLLSCLFLHVWRLMFWVWRILINTLPAQLSVTKKLKQQRAKPWEYDVYISEFNLNRLKRGTTLCVTRWSFFYVYELIYLWIEYGSSLVVLGVFNINWLVNECLFKSQLVNIKDVVGMDPDG